jgi:hypothetical protein
VSAGVLPEARVRLHQSVRWPGTAVPGLITAASYYSARGWSFWDVVGRGQNAVTLELEGHRYSELVLDVAEPDHAVAKLRRAIGPKSPE